MVTLTNFANFSKRATLFSILGIAALILLVVTFMSGGALWNSVFPPKPIAATVAFGKLPANDLSEGIKPQGQIKYEIETISGELPTLEGSAKVFVVETGGTSFGLLEDIKKKAVQIGFVQSPQILSNGFKFADPQNNSKTLVVNNVSGSFSYQTGLQDVKNPESVDAAISSARLFLKIFNLDEKEFPNNKVKTINLKVDGSNFVEAKSFSDANVVRVNFYRADLDKYPILPIIDGQSLNSALVASSVVEAKMNIYNLARHKFATYPLKEVQKAYEELQSGKGIYDREQTSDTFAVSNVSLAYVESSKTRDYLQPVYVFRSDSNINAFVSAVSEDWLIP